MENVSIGLLIGTNCIKALEPLEIISGENGGPYAMRTRLGWTVIGPVKPTRGDYAVDCNVT